MCKINGKKLCKIRKESGMSQAELARKVGVTTAAIQNYEYEKNSPSDANLDKICMILKINKGDIEIHDVGYNFLNQESKIVHNVRNKKGFVRYSTPYDTEKYVRSQCKENEETELKEVECALKNSFSIAGKKYILINPTFIHIPMWQRDTDMAKVQEIAQNFNEDKYDPVKVYTVNGKLFVADGAHRIIALIVNGEIKILVEVLSCNEHDAVLTFLGQQSARKTMTVSDTYRAGVEANIKEYLDFKHLFESENIQITTENNLLENPVGRIIPSASILRMVERDRENLLKSISTIKELDWSGSEKNPFTIRNFKVLKLIYANYGENIKDKLLSNCKGATFYESKVMPVKSNVELYDILSAEINK